MLKAYDYMKRYKDDLISVEMANKEHEWRLSKVEDALVEASDTLSVLKNHSEFMT